jgi:hypothetical protein
MLTRRATGGGAFWGAWVALGVVTVIAFTSKISFFYYTLIGLVITFAVGYLLSLRQPPRPPEELRGLVRGLEE